MYPQKPRINLLLVWNWRRMPWCGKLGIAMFATQCRQQMCIQITRIKLLATQLSLMIIQIISL